MGIQTYRSQVIAAKQVSTQCKVISLKLESPTNLQFKAGQHVIMDIPGIESKRSYSIASTPQQTNSIDLLIDTRPAGPGSRFLASVQTGDALTFLAPAGQFIVSSYSPADNLIFIATGSGICPLRSMIFDIFGGNLPPPSVRLLWGLRHERDIFWLEAFEHLKNTFSRFSFDISLSQPLEDGPYLRGRVTDHLRELTPSAHELQYYICGSKEMIASVVEQLNSAGVNSESIFFEKFY